MAEIPEEPIEDSKKYETVNSREVKLILKLSTGEMVKGSISVNKNSRTSDFFKADRSPFLTVHNVWNKEVEEGVMFIHKDHIAYVIPVED